MNHVVLLWVYGIEMTKIHDDVRKMVIMAGGTGGHVYPGLAVATRLREMKIPVVWLGAKSGIEEDIVPAHSIPLYSLSITGLRGNGFKKLIMAPIQLARAVFQAWAILRKEKPCAVLGLGGFASGPGGIAAWLLGIPIIIHEQNAIAGMTNRFLGRLAKKVLTAFPDAFTKKYKAVHVGNPLRAEFTEIPKPDVRFRNRQGRLRLLILGGSRGALSLNQVMPKAMAAIDKKYCPEIWHQTGKQHINITHKLYEEHAITAKVEPFIDPITAAYAWADLVICRAGALTVSELCAVGVASILIPYPYAVDDHQRANGLHLVHHHGALMVSQSELTVEKIVSLVSDLQNNKEKLFSMAKAARDLNQENAAMRVAESCLEVCK